VIHFCYTITEIFSIVIISQSFNGKKFVFMQSRVAILGTMTPFQEYLLDCMGATWILLKGVHSENSYTQVCLNHLEIISLANLGYPGRHIS
jgi:hypothetical protein